MRCIFSNRTIGIGCFSIGTNRTIGTNGPSVWRIVSVCVYWTCVYITGYCSFIRSTVHTEHGTVLVKVKTSEFGNWMKTRSFRTFSLKAHYYPAYYTWKGDDWPNWAVLSNSGISSMKKTFYLVFNFRSARTWAEPLVPESLHRPTDRPSKETNACSQNRKSYFGGHRFCF